MEKLHNLHYFCINGITRCEFQTKITLCFHAQCTNHSVINQKMRSLTVRILFDTVIRSALRQMQFFSLESKSSDQTSFLLCQY